MISDERVFRSTGLTGRQEEIASDEWYERAKKWIEQNRLPSEEFLITRVIFPQAIEEQWKVNEDKLANMAALIAVLAVEEFLEERKRSQVEIAAEAGISRRAWQKTWQPRCEELFDSLWCLCEKNVS